MVDKATIQGVLTGLGISEAGIAAALPALLGESAPALSPALLNMNQARAYLGGISRWTIMRAVQGGVLASVRIGRRVMFAPNDLSAFARGYRSRTSSIARYRQSTRSSELIDHGSVALIDLTR